LTTLLPGTQVAARGLRWEVVFQQPAGEQQLFRLRCLEGGLRGTEMDLLHPFEKIEPLATELNPAKAAPLPAFRLYLQAFLLEQALGPDALLAAQPGRLEIQPYQLVPVMRALQMSRPRLLLADGVGLGKTIQAGLVLAELIARRRAHRTLIVCPAGPLLEQWRVEMRERFGLRFDVLDSDRLQEIQYQNELGANPLDHVALGLVSIDFAKQERILQHLERTDYDVVIIDEAHHCMSLGTSAEREDSQRRRLAEVLARKSDALLLLTATPHDGFDPHFASLMELLDPSLVDGRGALRGDAYRRHVVRRLKRHIKDPRTGEDLFKKRQVHPVSVRFDPKSHPRFAALQEALLALIAPHLRRAVKQKRYGDVLAFLALLKRSVSTVAATRSTLQAISDRLAQFVEKGAEAQDERKQRLRLLRDYRRRLDRFGVLSFEEEQDHAALEAEDVAAELFEGGADDLLSKLGDVEREVRRERERLGKVSTVHVALTRLVEMADAAAPEDPKLRGILDALQVIRRAEPDANVLVYSEYADSQAAVVGCLRDAAKRGDLKGEVLAISGEDDDKTRMKVTERFKSQDGLVLVSTDACAEGLNLHARCHHLLHVELPYNPNRLEQRNGRIDRYGQKHDPVVRYLYLAGTFEERLLLRLVAKYEKQRERLTFVPNTLGLLSGPEDAGAVRLLEGVSQDGPLLFQQTQAPLTLETVERAEVDNPAYRDLLAEVEGAFSSFDKAARMHSWLGEVGAHAEEGVAREAEEARERSGRLGVGDLSRFVLDAARADLPPNSVREQPDGTFDVRLSGAWEWDLQEMPGYDPDEHRLRLTLDMSQTADGKGRPVGYLGRAHPVVRRAIDRVRNIQFGGEGDLLDRRVSAARADGSAPELLVVGLGTVRSGAGRELERVIAARVAQEGKPDATVDPAAWENWTELAKALPVAGLWERHFAAWGMRRIEDARRALTEEFTPLADAFSKSHQQAIDLERRAIDQWLRDRCDDLCGPLAPMVQREIFAGGKTTAPAWKTLTNPTERVASLASDASVGSRVRAEANTVIDLYQKRVKALEARARLEVAPVDVIGLLMLVPGEARGGRRGA